MYGHYMNQVHQRLKQRLSESVELMQKHYIQRRKIMEPLRKGELVLLNGRNIGTKHQCRKLEDKMLGLFEVVSVGSNNWYCKLKLPDHSKLHPVFNIDLREQYKGPDPGKAVVEIEPDGEDWVMETIMGCGPTGIHALETSAKTKSPSSNLFSLLYPQTQKNEIEVSLKYGIALLFQSVV